MRSTQLFHKGNKNCKLVGMQQCKRDPGFTKSRGDQRKTKLLIVDDDEQGLNVLELLLGNQGYEVQTARNGAQALDKAHIDPPDLIVSDIMMPVMDGFTLCRQWKKDDQLRDIPFIFYTATYTDPRDKGVALKLGVKRFILKPLEPKLFLKILEEVIEECRTSPGLVPSVLQFQEENAYFREYNDALVRRLENKVLELESAYDAIEREMIDRKRAEEALKASEEKYRNFVENASEGIFQSTPSGRYLSVNQALARMHGFDSPQELLASVTDIAHQVYLRVEDYDGLHHKLEAGASVDGYELELRRKDNSGIWVSMAARAVRGPDGELAYYEGTEVDITGRKQLETRLLQSQRMEAIVQLAGGIAHDFNNHLSVIMGFSGMLRMKMDEDDPRLNYVTQISSASEKAAGLTQSLLALSRKQAIELKPQKLSGIFRNFERLLRRLLHEDIELVLDLPETEILVMADVAQIDHVLLNLATRARQAMRQRGCLTITVQRAELDAEFMRCHGFGEPGDYAVIAVTDNGIGMDGATKKRVFEPFSGPDTGLTLSTVYGIIKQHKGFIEVSSSPDDGSTFFIYLPAMEAKSLRDLTVPHDTAGGHETILVAEDDADLRRLMRTILRTNGYRVVEAVDGEDALLRFSQQGEEIDLLLLDVVMPRMNGKETFDRIHETRSGIRVLFLSGYGGDIIVDKGICTDVSHYIAKPFDPGELLRKVRRVLDEPV